MPLANFFGENKRLEENKVGRGIGAKLKKSLVVGGLAVAMLVGSQASLAQDYSIRKIDSPMSIAQIKSSRAQATGLVSTIKGKIAFKHGNKVTENTIDDLALENYQKYNMSYFEAYSLIDDYVNLEASLDNGGKPVFNDWDYTLERHAELSQRMFGDMNGYDVMQAFAEIHNDLSDFATQDNITEAGLLEIINKHMDNSPDIPDFVWQNYVMEWASEGTNIHPKDSVNAIHDEFKKDPELKAKLNASQAGSDWIISPDKLDQTKPNPAGYYQTLASRMDNNQNTLSIG